jgi:hypothetical protein
MSAKKINDQNNEIANGLFFSIVLFIISGSEIFRLQMTTAHGFTCQIEQTRDALIPVVGCWVSRLAKYDLRGEYIYI